TFIKLHGCASPGAVNFLQQLKADFLDVEGALAYVRAFRLAEKLAEKAAAFHDGLAGRTPLRNPLHDVTGKRNISKNGKVRLKHSDLSGRGAARKHVMNSGFNRSQSAAYALLLFCGSSGRPTTQFCRNSKASDHDHGAFSDATADGKSGANLDSGQAQSTRNVASRLVAQQVRQWRITARKLMADEPLQRSARNGFVQTAHENTAFIIKPYVGGNNGQHAFDVGGCAVAQVG